MPASRRPALRLAAAALAAIATGVALLSGDALAQAGSEAQPLVRVGSKKFTESVVLGEIAAQLAEASGARVEHTTELGGTRLLWSSLIEGEIDVYAEYTGTLRHEIFARNAVPTDEDLLRELGKSGVAMTPGLGFNNTYAIGMLERRAKELGVQTVSDLARHPELALGLSSEFMDRMDGWPGLRDLYRLPQQDVKGMDHDLAYRGLLGGYVDAIDLYSTDAEIRHYGLRVLEDDRRYFPQYRAVYIYREDLALRAPEFVASLERLAGTINAPRMIEMNGRAKIHGESEPDIAARFLASALGVRADYAARVSGNRLWHETREHFALVAMSLAAAIAIAVPLGVLAARFTAAGQAILAAVGVLQTVPSLALLVFMIPLLGIGRAPALAALFLYSLLPIVRNTHAGITGIAPELIETADALGLSSGQRLRVVELPLASPAILAGIQTSAVINVGTATLGALIGAGGYGQAILTGIRLNDTGLILQGALPAAAMAIAMQGLFELLGRTIVPAGLRLERTE